ncbi:hypothetical protein HPB51_011439 [Rhipicephalus microplus]|uniref:Uncharacterized protein n=1 Tax=Rhipicephalus microplus TaxID=6941 RepID=A0A9J6EFZ2_RHIMP|nr:hypothetical protein HPB51_011439 [Rhipicephalus microplus]
MAHPAHAFKTSQGEEVESGGEGKSSSSGGKMAADANVSSGACLRSAAVFPEVSRSRQASTVSSIINSQAAVFYVDVISQYRKFSSQQAAAFTKKSGFYGRRATLTDHDTHLCAQMWTLQGAAIGTLVAGSLQLWLMFGKIALDIHSPRMGVTVDYCPVNTTFPVTYNSTFIDDEVSSVERYKYRFVRVNVGERRGGDNIPAEFKEDEDEKDILRHEFRRDESFDSNESNV